MMAEQIPFSIAENLLFKLGSVAFREIGLMYGVREELTKLHKKLSMIKDVILDAEEQQLKSEQARSRAIASWIRRLKDVVYDADDLLDDFATEDLRRKTDVLGRCGGQVRDFFSSSNHLAFRIKMGHRIKDIRERLDEIANDMSQFSFTSRVITVAPRVENRERETHSGLEKCHEIVGRDENKKEIVELLKQSSTHQNLSLVGIVGMGGLGKTTLAQLVYNDHGLVNHFDMKMWVCVSDNFDVKLLCRNILESAINGHVVNLGLDLLRQDLQMKLDGKRYLLVLDDVWNDDPDKWEKLRNLLPDGTNGSKILMTTRSNKVASVMGINHPYTLKGLDEDESWNLFRSLAFKQGQENLGQSLLTIAKEIVKMCKGIPLVIKTLGRMLSSEIREDKWLLIRNNENLMRLDQDEKILSVLKLSYDALPIHLKQCFTYCALFPKDHHIEKDSLIQLWMAQGYIQCSREGGRLEDVGEQYFEELLWRSFFQEIEQDDDGNIFSCKMHDLIHDLAQSIVNNEISILTHVSSNITERVHHVSVIGRINYQEVFRAKSIRTFLSFGSYSKLDHPPVKIRCQNLRALDLGVLQISKVPKCFSKLSHLRYFDLSYNDFDELPKFITRLQNLQTLNLSGCNKLKELPRDIGKLINLRHLLIDDCESLGHMPCGLGELTELQTLPFFVVGKGSGDSRCKAIGSLSELKRLNNLRGKLEIRNLENVRDAAVICKKAILVEKQYLQSLDLEWEVNMEANNRSEDADELVMEGLQPHSNLKKLCINGYGGVTFPSWMRKDGLRRGLSCLGIVACHKLTSFSHSSFPCLEKLILSGVREELLGQPMFAFSSLKKLSIRNIDDVMSLPEEGMRCLTSLNHLDIGFCKSLKSLSPGVQHLTALETLEISRCIELDFPDNEYTDMLFQGLRSLRHLTLTVIPKLACLPKGLQHVTTLENLHIFGPDGFDTLPDWIATFPSLTSLNLSYCKGLKSLPEGMSSMSSLQKLRISGCPYLEGRCQKETGEDWPKISHIPSVVINGKLIKPVSSS